MPETTQEIKKAVRAYILDEFLPGEGTESLDDSTPLITGGVLNSIATVKLVAFLEERFGIALETHEVSEEYLNTLPDIASLVESKRSR